MVQKLKENEISEQIVLSSVEVHRTLGGPGLLESVFEEALTWELMARGRKVQRQLAVPIIYDYKSTLSQTLCDSAAQRLCVRIHL